jgi:hypothetical protein
MIRKDRELLGAVLRRGDAFPAPDTGEERVGSFDDGLREACSAIRAAVGGCP